MRARLTFVGNGKRGVSSKGIYIYARKMNPRMCVFNIALNWEMVGWGTCKILERNLSVRVL